MKVLLGSVYTGGGYGALERKKAVALNREEAMTEPTMEWSIDETT